MKEPEKIAFWGATPTAPSFAEGAVVFCDGCLSYQKLGTTDAIPVVVEVLTAAGPEWCLFCGPCQRKLDKGSGCYPND